MITKITKKTKCKITRNPLNLCYICLKELVLDYDPWLDFEYYYCPDENCEMIPFDK